MKRLLSFFLAVVMMSSVAAAPVEAYAAAKPKATHITKLTSTSDSITVKWKKVKGVAGYQIQYSTSESFKNKSTKKVTVKKAKTVRRKVKNLKANKEYWVRVRTYKVINGKKKYSKWSRKKLYCTEKKHRKRQSGYKMPEYGIEEVLIPDKLLIDTWGDYVYVDEYEVLYKEYHGIEIYSSSGKGRYSWAKEYRKLLYETYLKLNLDDSMNDLTRLIIIARWFKENIVYAYDESGNPDRSYGEAISALKYGKTVCHGYACLLNDLCYLTDIPCYYLSNSVHAWNAVKLQGYWYEVDFVGGKTAWWRGTNYLEWFTLNGYDKVYDIESIFGFHLRNTAYGAEIREMKGDAKSVWDTCIPQGTFETAELQYDNYISAYEIAVNHQFKS